MRSSSSSSGSGSGSFSFSAAALYLNINYAAPPSVEKTQMSKCWKSSEYAAALLLLLLLSLLLLQFFCYCCFGAVLILSPFIPLRLHVPTFLGSCFHTSNTEHLVRCFRVVLPFKQLCQISFLLLKQKFASNFTPYRCFEGVLKILKNVTECILFQVSTSAYVAVRGL